MKKNIWMVYCEYDVKKSNYFDSILDDVICFMLLWIVIFFISYDLYLIMYFMYDWINLLFLLILDICR